MVRQRTLTPLFRGFKSFHPNQSPRALNKLNLFGAFLKTEQKIQIYISSIRLSVNRKLFFNKIADCESTHSVSFNPTLCILPCFHGNSIHSTVFSSHSFIALAYSSHGGMRALMIFGPSQSKINLNENIQSSIYSKINQAPQNFDRHLKGLTIYLYCVIMLRTMQHINSILTKSFKCANICLIIGVQYEVILHSCGGAFLFTPKLYHIFNSLSIGTKQFIRATA